GSARWVTFVDMDAVGTNPARILPTWRTFAAPHLAAGRRIRGVGEPISPGRRAGRVPPPRGAPELAKRRAERRVPRPVRCRRALRGAAVGSARPRRGD